MDGRVYQPDMPCFDVLEAEAYKKLLPHTERLAEGKIEDMGQEFPSLLPCGGKERIWKMEQLSMIENELVPVYTTSTGEKVVYGTDLHRVLEVRSHYRD